MGGHGSFCLFNIQVLGLLIRGDQSIFDLNYFSLTEKKFQYWFWSSIHKTSTVLMQIWWAKFCSGFRMMQSLWLWWVYALHKSSWKLARSSCLFVSLVITFALTERINNLHTHPRIYLSASSRTDTRAHVPRVGSKCTVNGTPCQILPCREVNCFQNCKWIINIPLIN